MHAIFIDTTLTTPPTGGAQTFLVDLCRDLTMKNWRIAVVTQPGPEHAVIESLQEAGVEVRADLWRASQLPEERARTLAAWVNSQCPDVYIISISPAIGWLALPLLDSAISTISIAHNDVDAFYDPVAHYAPFIDCAVCVSEEIARRTREECGMPADRVRPIPYGVRPVEHDEAMRRINSARGQGEPLKILYVGRVVERQKRVSDFVPLALELKKRGLSAELHIIGDGSERASLEAEIARNDLSAMFRFWGWLSPGEVKARLGEGKVFTLLSDHEGLPVALLEAMGSALAPVVTRIASGNTQLIRDGENGMLFPVGDVTACADRLALLFADSTLLKSLRRAAWETSLEYSLARMVEHYEECFQHVTGPQFSRTHRDGISSPYPPLPSSRSRYPFWLRKVKQRVAAAVKSARRSRTRSENS
jgi:glycosyltransferase involved in cell wall biosynthesis